MSIDICLQVDTGGPEPAWIGPDLNYTHNVQPMWREALGISPCDFAGRTAASTGEVLLKGIADMETRPDHYRTMNPSNGWGDYEGALQFLRDLLALAEAHPKATWWTSC